MIQYVTNWVEPEQSSSMCMGKYTCESAADVAADSHDAGLQRWKAIWEGFWSKSWHRQCVYVLISIRLSSRTRCHQRRVQTYNLEYRKPRQPYLACMHAAVYMVVRHGHCKSAQDVAKIYSRYEYAMAPAQILGRALLRK